MTHEWISDPNPMSPMNHTPLIMGWGESYPQGTYEPSQLNAFYSPELMRVKEKGLIIDQIDYDHQKEYEDDDDELLTLSEIDEREERRGLDVYTHDHPEREIMSTGHEDLSLYGEDDEEISYITVLKSPIGATRHLGHCLVILTEDEIDTYYPREYDWEYEDEMVFNHTKWERESSSYDDCLVVYFQPDERLITPDPINLGPPPYLRRDITVKGDYFVRKEYIREIGKDLSGYEKTEFIDHQNLAQSDEYRELVRDHNLIVHQLNKVKDTMNFEPENRAQLEEEKALLIQKLNDVVKAMNYFEYRRQGIEV